MGETVVHSVLQVLNGGGDLRFINYTYILLIPKIKKPLLPFDYQFISLCNVIFKIVTKAIVNHLKVCLLDIVDPCQSAFVLGRLITYNTLLAFKIFH